jgi:hypothetical protein
MMAFCAVCGNEFEARAGARFCSAICRQRAHRGGSVEITNSLGERVEIPLSVEEEQRLRQRFGYTSSERRTMAERDAAAARMLGRSSSFPSEQEYVAQALEGARAHHTETSSGATLSTVSSGDRLRRAEAYARWRYRGFLRGEVASL